MSPRIVPPDEARSHAAGCRERGFEDMAEFWDGYAVLGEQREAVLALHPRFTLYAYCEGDWNACDPSDSNHAESVYDGELMHLNDRIDEVCGSCFGDDGERVPYPCPTARAIGVES